MKVLRIVTAILLAGAGIALLLYWTLIVGLYYAFAGGLPVSTAVFDLTNLFFVLSPFVAIALILLCLRIGHPKEFKRLYRRRQLSSNEIEVTR
jgi:hypothetical protein